MPLTSAAPPHRTSGAAGGLSAGCPLVFHTESAEFDSELGQYVIDTLAAYMKQYYQEREVSRVNKQISIVGKDISIDGQGHGKTAARNELEYCEKQSDLMTFNQKPTAYS